MEDINKLMKGVNKISKIQFKLSNEEGDIFISPEFKDDSKSCISESFFIGSYEVKITINKENKIVLPLLEHYIKNSIMEINYQKDRIILDIIEGREVLKEEFALQYPFLIDKFSIIVIYIEENIEEAFELIEAGYKGMDAVTILYKDRIIILGILDDSYEHTLSIKETLSYNFSGKCIISYSRVNNYIEIKDILDRCNNKIFIAQKFNVRNEIIGQNDLIFEEIVQSISCEQKDKLIKKYSKKFDLINVDLFNTVEVFFECGLNISESANKLFIHRNTLIYRLDKIQKSTGFDVKNFNEAILFKMILLIWKEEHA